MFRHPHLLAILQSQLGSILQVSVLQGRMTIDVTGNDVNLLASHRVVQQHVGIVGAESERLGTNQTYAWIGCPVKHVGIVLHQVELLLRLIETAGIAHPPVGLVLDRHCIDIDPLATHPLQELVQPRKELVIAVFAKLAPLIPLVLGITALSRVIGFIFAWGRPRSSKDNTTALLDDFCRGQRTIPVVRSIIVAPLRNNDVANLVGRNLHA